MKPSFLLRRPALLAVMICLMVFLQASPSFAQNAGLPNQPFAQNAFNDPTLGLVPPAPEPASTTNGLGGLDPDAMMSPGGLTSSLKLLMLLTVLSLAPSILLMTTCFLRIVIVMGLLRQAIGTQSLPPNQVLISLSLFLTAMVMWPTWQKAYDEGVKPYSSSNYRTKAEQQTALSAATTRTLAPMREFMSNQISRTGNDSAIWLFWEYEQEKKAERGETTVGPPQHYDEVPLTILLPAYLLSELKTAFVIGFQLYLPFVVIDMVIATILISMGMMMLPPAMISLPFKILLFVLVDGWTLTVSMLLKSIA